MRQRIPLGLLCFCLLAGLWPTGTAGQEEEGERLIDTIARLATISANDQVRIQQWIEEQVTALKALSPNERKESFQTYRTKFKGRYDNRENTDQFRVHLAARTAAVAVQEFGASALDPMIAHVLAYALIDMSRVETVPGLIAGIKSKDAVARVVCARGLDELKPAIAADKAVLDSVVTALRETGARETEPVVLRRVYSALAYREHAAVVLPAYLELMRARLEYRRGSAVQADGAELTAYEFFRNRNVLTVMNAGQQAELVGVLAVFFRLDAERYRSDGLAPPEGNATGDINFYERDALERMLEAVEVIFVTLVPEQPTTIADELRAGGHGQRVQILDRVYQWVGDPRSSTRGILNAAPWNVPVGAP